MRRPESRRERETHATEGQETTQPALPHVAGRMERQHSATVLPSATGGDQDLRLRMVKGRLGSMRFGFRSVVGFGAPTGEEGDGASAVVSDGRSCGRAASDP